MEGRDIEVKTENKNTKCEGYTERPDYICDGNGEYRDIGTNELFSAAKIQVSSKQSLGRKEGTQDERDSQGCVHNEEHD